MRVSSFYLAESFRLMRDVQKDEEEDDDDDDDENDE